MKPFKAEISPVKSEDGTSAINLERKGSFRQSVGFITLYLCLELSKQMLNYLLATRTDNKYPIPTPVILFLNELFKLSAVMSYLFFKRKSISSYQPSLKFSIPAICYFCTNLLYLRALQKVAPPVWMVLIQTRTIYTAIIYKLVFGRSVTVLQMVGCVLIVTSIPIAKLTDVLETSSSTSRVTASIIGISQMCALLSTVAAVSVELLLKNDYRTFAEQQIWLYSFGAFYAIISLPFIASLSDVWIQITALSSMSTMILSTSVVVTGLAGLCVPFIVKNLDTIVKDYLGAANNITLSAVTALMFPALFSLSWSFICSLIILFIGITLYERCPETQPTKALLPMVTDDNKLLERPNKGLSPMN